MTLVIDIAAPADYPAIAEVRNAAAPPGDTRAHPDELERWDTSLHERYARRRYVLRWRGRVVGTASRVIPLDFYHPRKFYVDVVVHPDHQRRGLGSTLYDHVIKDLPVRPLCLRSGCREDQMRGTRFLEQRGYREEERTWESILEFDAFDPSTFESPARRFAELGLDVRTLSEIQRDPEWRQKLYDLFTDTERDQPLPESYTRPPFDAFFRIFDNSPGRFSEGFLVAVEGDHYVAVTLLEEEAAEPDQLFTAFTGVRREHRGHGIALGLKLRAVAVARTMGRKRLPTFNSSRNEAMLAINQRLGFVKRPAHVGFVLDLEEALT